MRPVPTTSHISKAIPDTISLRQTPIVLKKKIVDECSLLVFCKVLYLATPVVFQLIMYGTTDIKIRDTPEKVHSLVSSKKPYGNGNGNGYFRYS